MLSDTLASGLAEYRIGQKVRALRLRKSMGLVQLGRHTGLSPAMLSKIERGQLFPTLPTLLRIALVFGVGLEHFFVERHEAPMIAVTRKGERLKLPDRPEAEAPCYFFESLDFPATDRKMDAYYAEFPAKAAATEPHAHEGAEFIYMLKGGLDVIIDETELTLDEGDAVHFDSAAEHSYRARGRSTAAAIVVIAS